MPDTKHCASIAQPKMLKLSQLGAFVRCEEMLTRLRYGHREADLSAKRCGLGGPWILSSMSANSHGP